MLKLLDYGRPNPFGETIGRQRNLAWPVNAYRVTLPRSSKDSDGLNPFERVILKLLDALGVMDARALADETCIPLDLVKSILLRLQDKELIDEFNTIIEQEDDSSRSKPAFLRALGAATVGAVVNHSGSCSASAKDTIRAKGVIPNSLTLASLINIVAAAPSLMVEALAAVTVPSLVNTARSVGILSNFTFLYSSSWATTIGSPFLVGTCTGTTSSLK